MIVLAAGTSISFNEEPGSVQSNTIVNDGTVTNSYSTAALQGIAQVGGMAGINNGTLTNVYSTGTVIGTSQVGGLVGENAGVVNASYWDTQTSAVATSAAGTGQTSAEMALDTTFVGWDFTTIWEITSAYPTLR